MIERFGKLAFAVIAPLFLFGCILTPGKFVSSLTINKDRSFTFTYQGEVIAIDPSEEFTKGMKSTPKEDAPADDKKSSFADDDDKKDEESEAKSDDAERKRRAVAEALSKEAGYKSVQYVGNGKYVIDYAISGVLSHNFTYPFNQDAEIIFPFIMVEVRAGNTVRMRAPGFADGGDTRNKSGMGSGSGGDASKFLDGVFTLDTDAEIVSQNNEDGPTRKGGRSIIKWRATPLTKDAPSAVLRMGK